MGHGQVVDASREVDQRLGRLHCSTSRPLLLHPYGPPLKGGPIGGWSKPGLPRCSTLLRSTFKG